MVIGAAMRPAGGVFLDVAEQLIHDHGHRAHHHQAAEREPHLHG